MPNLPGKKPNGKCYIVGAVPCDLSEIRVQKDDFVIGADAGWEHLRDAKLPIHFAVGDWDSGEMPTDGAVRTVPVEKDDTDMMLAVKEGLARGYQEFYLYGGMGGERTDHTLANIETLIYLAEHGARGTLLSEREAITAIRNETLFFQKPQGRVSVFAVGEAKGVTLSGMKYPLKDGSLTESFPLGVSNSFQGEKAHISVKDGTLVIVTEKEVMG